MRQQIELNLGGKKRKFTFGILFIGKLLQRDEFEHYGDLIHKMQSNPFLYTHIVMYESLVNTCNKYNKTIDFTEDDVIKWIEADYKDGAVKFMDFVYAFLGTNENNTPIENEEDTGETKKNRLV